MLNISESHSFNPYIERLAPKFVGNEGMKLYYLYMVYDMIEAYIPSFGLQHEKSLPRRSHLYMKTPAAALLERYILCVKTTNRT